MGIMDKLREEGSYSNASGASGLQYVVLQVTLKEKLIGTGSGNLTELEKVINAQAAKGYRLAYNHHRQRRQQGPCRRRSHPGHNGI